MLFLAQIGRFLSKIDRGNGNDEGMKDMRDQHASEDHAEPQERLLHGQNIHHIPWRAAVNVIKDSTGWSIIGYSFIQIYSRMDNIWRMPTIIGFE